MDIFLFVSLLVGFFIGLRKWLPEAAVQWNSRLQTVWLLLLIFSMGASIGKDQEMIRLLPALGGKAFLFAAVSICGSVLFVWFVSRFFEKEARK